MKFYFSLLKLFFYYISVHFFLFSVVSCTKKDMAYKYVPSENNQNLVSVLEEENKVLQIKNEQLETRINQLELKLASSEKELQEKLKVIDDTVLLLEENMKDLENTQQLSQEKVSNVLSSISKAHVSKNSTSIKNQKKTTQQKNIPIKKSQVKTNSSNNKNNQTKPILGNKLNSIAPKKQLQSNKNTSNKTSTKIIAVPILKNEKSKQDPQKKKTIPFEDPIVASASKHSIQLVVSPGAKKFYQEAYQKLSSKEHLIAINHFETFLQKFPNDLDADNAQFWIGYCHWKMNHFILAEQAFRKVLQKYPHGNTVEGYKTPDAIFMLGKIYEQKKKKPQAKYYFQKVIEFYPLSSSANKANQELKAL